MISYNRFRLFLEKHLLDPLIILPQGYLPAHSTKIQDFQQHFLQSSFYDKQYHNDFNGTCIWWHEEPLNQQDLDDLSNRTILLNPHLCPECRDWHDCPIPGHGPFEYTVNFQIFANSEKSQLKKHWIKNNPPLLDWYFFFHGFAALDWYRDFNYLQNICNYSISKVFICLNHLLKDNRSYRLHLISLLEQNNLINQGIVSAQLLNKDLVKKEVFNSQSRLSKEAKKHILTNLLPIANPIEAPLVESNLAYSSADIPDYFYKCFLNVVTETNFYDEKLHLTEKIFKPIVIKRPFVLVSSPGNLEYLKSYGFETFNKWIDESYDLEPDPDLRLLKIVNEIKKLASLSAHELDKLHKEMQPVLDYNHNHFFNNFKKIIVNELVDNFEACTKIYNLSLSERFRLPAELVDYNQVKNLLLS